MSELHKYSVEVIKKTKTYPKHLLGNSIKEAEELLKEFSMYINNVTRAYSEVTKIDRGDLFGEAVIALGQAKRDFDSEKGWNFAPFAKFIIIDAMNEYVRKNKAIVSVPAYIDKAHKIIARIKSSIFNYTDSLEDILIDSKFDEFKIPESIKAAVLHDKELLSRAAKRSTITLEKLIARAEFLPLTLHENNSEKMDNGEGSILAKLLVGKILPLLNTDETEVARLIMRGKNKSEICDELNRHDDWVTNRIKAMHSKAKQMLLSRG